jgi:hypothetical protein
MSLIKTFDNKFHWLRMASFISFSGFIIAVFINESLQKYLLESIHTALNFEPLYYIIISVSFSLGAYYSYYFLKVKVESNLLLFKLFGPLIDPPANTLAFGVVLASVLRLLRGLFSQFFYKEIYFKDFGFIDVTAITMCCFVLLVWSVNGLVNYFVNLFVKQPSPLAKVEPATSENEN